MAVKHAIESYRQAAELMQPGWGAWTYDRFQEFNSRYFDNKVPLMPIIWVPMAPYGHLVGLAEYKGRILLWDKRCLDEGYAPGLFAEHVLLHEMLHQYLWTTNEDPSHNGALWCRVIMRIGQAMGLSFHASPSKSARLKNDDGTSKVKRHQKPDENGRPSIPLDGGINQFPHFAFNYDAGTVRPEYRA